MLPFPFVVPVNVYAVLGAIAAVVVMIIVALVARKMVMGRLSARREGEKLYALIIDDESRECYWIELNEIAKDVYAGNIATQPVFLVVTPHTKVYRFRSGKREYPTVFARAKGIVLFPIDPALVSEYSMLVGSSPEDAARFEEVDIVEALKNLLEIEKERRGYIRLCTPIKFAVSFDMKKLVKKMIDRVMGQAYMTVLRLFEFGKSIESYERLLRHIVAYTERRMSWIIYVGIAIFIVAMAVMAIMMAMHGGATMATGGK